MLVLRLYDGARHIGTITMADLSDGAAVADYECRLTDVEGRECEWTVYGHRREDGAWELAKKVLERMMPI